MRTGRFSGLKSGIAHTVSWVYSSGMTNKTYRRVTGAIRWANPIAVYLAATVLGVVAGVALGVAVLTYL